MTMFRRSSFVFLVVVISALGSVASAQETEQHPIDTALEQCIEKNGSTHGMIQCAAEARVKWDAEMQRNYDELRKRLPAAARAALLRSQREWIRFRDHEFEMLSRLYGSFQGTMYLPMHEHARLRIVKDRAMRLGDYLELIKAHS